MSEWMSVKEVARMYEVAEQTVYRWISAGHLVAYKLGPRYRIKREDARAVLARAEPSALADPAARRRREIEAVVEDLRRRGYEVGGP